MPIELPTAPAPPDVALSHQTITMYGRPGIGKSTFGSNAPDALMLATEPGLNHLTAYKLPIATWDEFLEACKLLAEGAHKFQSVIIDTVDNLHKACDDYICKRENIRHIAELPDKRGYSMLNNEFKRVLTKLALLPYGLYLISHDRTTEVKTQWGKETRIVPGLNDTGNKIICGMSDFVLYADMVEAKDEAGVTTGHERVIHCQPTNMYIAKTRVKSLPDPLPLDYAAFVAAYNAATAAEGA